MKYVFLLFFIFTCQSSFANLYLETVYQEGQKPKIATKHHIFLDKRYTVNYTKKSYVLILKKINGDEATIESETYDVNKVGHKTMEGGSYGTYKIGKGFELTDTDSTGHQLFKLKILLEKIVPTKP